MTAPPSRHKLHLQLLLLLAPSTQPDGAFFLLRGSAATAFAGIRPGRYPDCFAAVNNPASVLALRCPWSS
jgi:hypothetical protein